ncbi:MAG: leucine-rich repeat protein [Butyrivibrio sp.]|nr:leucine-rich repeat protein [Butyrivibrio sp.]
MKNTSKVLSFLSSSMLLITVILAFQMTFISNAAGTTTFQLNGLYYQTDARSMLSLINEYRQSGNAWQYNSDGSVNNLGQISALTYDYNLEKIAMQRAMEISVKFSHARPNATDTSSFNTYTYNGTISYGENILIYGADLNAEGAYEIWLETNESYSGQGHRRNMLNSSYASIGISHVEVNGYHFWVQEFGYTNSNASSTTALNSTATVSVDVLTDSLNRSLVEACVYSYNGCNSIDYYNLDTTTSLYYGDTFDLSDICEITTIDDDEDYPFEQPLTVSSISEWTSSSASVVSISNSVATAAGTGSATLIPSVASGNSYSIGVTVNAVNIAYSTVTFDKDSYYFTGEEIIPTVTVTRSGKILTEGTDYTLSYANNVFHGYGRVTVTGIGNYTGSVIKSFSIDENPNYEDAEDVEEDDEDEDADDEDEETEEAKQDEYLDEAKLAETDAEMEEQFEELINEISDSENNDSSESSESSTDSDISTDSGKTKKSSAQKRHIYKKVIYEINGSTAKVVGCNQKITTYNAPLTITVSGKKYKVTEIAAAAFYNQTSLKKVNLENSNIKTIGKFAFYKCSKLKNVKLNATKQKKYQTGAFYRISNKAKITIKASNKKQYSKTVKTIKKSNIYHVTFKKK